MNDDDKKFVEVIEKMVTGPGTVFLDPDGLIGVRRLCRIIRDQESTIEARRLDVRNRDGDRKWRHRCNDILGYTKDGLCRWCNKPKLLGDKPRGAANTTAGVAKDLLRGFDIASALRITKDLPQNFTLAEGHTVKQV